MALHDVLPLFLFVIVATITPGGATALATVSGAHFGYRRSLPYMAGVAIALGSMAAFAAVGLGGLLLARPALQVGIKAMGSLYLVWLASRIGRSGTPHLGARLHKPAGFASGLWMLWHNPKGWAMTLGAAASFATLAPGPLELAALLGISFGIAATGSLSAWCFAGLLLARLLRTELQWKLLNCALAILLVMSIITMWL